LGEVEQERVPAFLTTDFFAGLVSQMTPKFLVRSVLKTAYGNPELLSEIIFERYLNLLRKEGTRKNILQVKQEAEPDWGYQDRLASITSPTFVLWGEKDSWIPVDVIDIFKEALSLSNDHIIIYPDLGHVPMEEDPSTVYDYLAFIDSLN
jgi:pimeloyl-ACP methyl ester carboxylesterase